MSAAPAQSEGQGTDPAQGATRKGPLCPFCEAPWTEAMLDHYDAMTDPNGCACCGSAGMIEHGQDHHHHEERPVPVADLCCEACGKPIYRAPASV